MSTKIIINGSKGRMGQALAACAKNFREIEVVAAIDQDDDLADVIPSADVVIDFSAHTATVEVAKLCAAHKKALVIGTTGHTDTDTFEITKNKVTIPIVWHRIFPPASTRCSGSRARPRKSSARPSTLK